MTSRRKVPAKILVEDINGWKLAQTTTNYILQHSQSAKKLYFSTITSAVHFLLTHLPLRKKESLEALLLHLKRQQTRFLATLDPTIKEIQKKEQETEKPPKKEPLRSLPKTKKPRKKA